MTRQDQLRASLLANLDRWPTRDRYMNVGGNLWHFRAGRAYCGYTVVTRQEWIREGRVKA